MRLGFLIFSIRLLTARTYHHPQGRFPQRESIVIKMTDIVAGDTQKRSEAAYKTRRFQCLCCYEVFRYAWKQNSG